MVQIRLFRLSACHDHMADELWAANAGVR